jgi:hypothetical protein
LSVLGFELRASGLLGRALPLESCLQQVFKRCVFCAVWLIIGGAQWIRSDEFGFDRGNSLYFPMHLKLWIFLPPFKSQVLRLDKGTMNLRFYKIWRSDFKNHFVLQNKEQTDNIWKPAHFIFPLSKKFALNKICGILLQPLLHSQILLVSVQLLW